MVFRWILILVAAVLLTAASMVIADSGGPCNSSLNVPLDPLLKEDGWKCAREDGSVQIYARKMAGTVIHEIAAVTVMPLPIEKIARVLADVERYPEFMPYVDKCRIQGRTDRGLLVFQQLNFPFPFNDRHYTVIMLISDPSAPSGAFGLHWELADPEFQVLPGNGVLLTANRGFWKLAALADGRGTMITYYIYTDPGGSLPAWAVNTANTAAVPCVLKAVRARAEELGASE